MTNSSNTKKETTGNICYYRLYFSYKDNVYPIPVNPEQIEVSSSQAIEKYEVLKLGQISVPTHMGLKEYSFECEFPIKRGGKIPHYVSSPDHFYDADFFVKLFEKWRSALTPVRFIAGRVNTDTGELEPDPINTLVLIEELTIVEKAGEEGDKYISFKLIEYKEYGERKPPAEIDPKTGKRIKKASTRHNPKSTGYYTIKSGDTLWAIAKKYYGDGAKYTKIVSANKDKIKNPNLIKVGWKLVIPE